VSIAVRDDADWRSFCRALGRPSLAGDPRFAEPQARYQHRDELDAIVTHWTSTLGQYQVMEALQAVGVPAGPVLNAQGLLADPHFRARGFFEEVDHPPETGLGRREYVGRGWKLSETEVRMRGPAPMLGEANDYVLRQMLGLAQGEIARLRQAGAIGEDPVGGQTPSTVPLERQVELGWTVGHDPFFREAPKDAGER
jgi:formyl-CoA transferase/CoA:oxalate CoA-transferase